MRDGFNRLFDRIEKRLGRIEGELLRDIEETLKKALEIPARGCQSMENLQSPSTQLEILEIEL